MTLEEVQFPVSLEWCKGYALVFAQPLAERLSELHAAHGNPNCWPIAASLPDGRYYLHADVLTEVLPGGLLHSMWSAADPAILLPSVEVVPIADVLPPIDPPAE
jgi:hypothetical protein